MTQKQHTAQRELELAQLRWLDAYGWKVVGHTGKRVAHVAAPKSFENFSVGDAMAMTRAEPLRYGAS